MAFLIGGANSAADGVFSVANSCRFDRASDASMTLSMSSGGSTTKFTKSFWVKRCAVGEQHYLFDNSGVAQVFGRFTDDDRFAFGIYHTTGGYSTDLSSTAFFRDPSAWYNFVIAVDYTSGTQAHRVRIYVNGTEITSWATETRPSNDSTTFDTWNSSKTHYIGNTSSGSHDAHVYFAEVVHIDGLALTPTSFGEFDEDSPTIWKPIDVSGLTFGTKGFYLDFEDSDNLGDDESGNTADWTEVNLAATDQSADTPTNNWATWTPLAYTGKTAIAEGNLQGYGYDSGSLNAGGIATIGVSTGKWYWENKITAIGGAASLGIYPNTANIPRGLGNNDLHAATNSIYYKSTGNKQVSDSDSSYGDSYTTNDIIGVALNLDDNEIKFYKNGTVQNSGTAISVNSISDFYFPVQAGLTDSSVTANFGSPPYANSSDVADADGYGAFEYAPPSGFYALNTKNLATYG